MLSASFPRWPRATIFAVCVALLLFLAVLHGAWLCDDAFITLRTVDNWVHGYGLRWNAAERVQSFTHPLWLFAVSLPYFLTRHPATALLLPALLATGLFLGLFIRATSDKLLAGGLLLVLLASKAFVEFSTSGLENPLLHLLLLAYGLAFARILTERNGPAQSGLPRLVLCASLLLITRADMLVLIGPSLLAATWFARAELARPRTWLGLAPLALWQSFALFYYGFPFPNTAYAKLETAVPRGEALSQGLHFLRACITHDPITPLVIAAAILVGLAARGHALWLGLGLLSWVAYLVSIGGDFMIGRLLTPALVVSLLIFVARVPPRVARLTPWLGAPLVVVALLMPRTALLGAPREVLTGWLPDRVTDERAIFHTMTGLFRDSHPEGPAGHPWALEALARKARGERLFTSRSVGFAGYFAGPEVHIVDEFALADPLLARLPASPKWNPGHFERSIPKGYLATLDRKPNRLEPASLARRYDALTLIIRGPLFSLERLRAILRWQFGPKHIYPADYAVTTVRLRDLGKPRDNASINAKGVLKTGEQGLAIALDKPTEIRGLTVSVGDDDQYLLALRKGRKVLWQEWVAPGKGTKKALESHVFALPRTMQVDSLIIRGRRGDYRYHVGAVRFSPAGANIRSRDPRLLRGHPAPGGRK